MHTRQSSLVRAIDITKKALYDINNMDQSDDVKDLTCNPQETASAAKLRMTTILSEIDTMVESFSIQANAQATRFPTLLRRQYQMLAESTQKRPIQRVVGRSPHR